MSSSRPFPEFKLRAREGELSLQFSLEASFDPENAELLTLLGYSWLKLLSNSRQILGAAFHKPARVFRAFAHELQTDIIGTIRRFSKLADRLLQGQLNYGGDLQQGLFIDEMLDTPCAYEYIVYYKTGDLRILDYLTTFLLFGKKVEYTDPSFYADAFRVWLEVEESLACIDLQDSGKLATIVSQLLPALEEEQYFFKHGPGTVVDVDGRKSSVKTRQGMKYDRLIDRTFFQQHHWCRKGTNGRISAHPWAEDWRKRETDAEYSELLFVFKDVNTARTICRETSTKMFFQQGYLTVMLDMMKAGPLSNYVDLSDQERNRQLAEEGSIDGFIDTIDLSHASDSVTWDLVKAIFPKRILRFLAATRSKKVLLPTGEIMAVRKFAPMGSALCFPTQTVIYSSVVILAYARFWANGDDELEDSLLRNVTTGALALIGKRPAKFAEQLRPFTVFGDDILCDTRVTPIVTSILTRLGFSVNLSKSFQGGQAVRESCGKYFAAGTDITPSRFRVKRGSMMYPSLVAAINNFGDAGYRELQGYLIALCKQWYRGTLFVKDDAPHGVTPERVGKPLGIITKRSGPINGHLQRRSFDIRAFIEGAYEEDIKNAASIPSYLALQRDEVRGYVVKTKLEEQRESFDSFEQYLYLQWERSAVRRFDYVAQWRGDVAHVRMGWGWTPG